MDCKYSTIKNILIALIGGTANEFACTEQVEKELRQMKVLEQQAAKLIDVEKKYNAAEARLAKIDEQHRQDIRIIKAEYQEQITFLKEQLKVWQTKS